MGLFPFLVAAAAIKKSRTRSRSKRMGSSSTSKRLMGGVHYSSREYPYVSYLMKELDHKESAELSDFFAKLFSYGKEIVEEHNSEVMKVHEQQLEDIHNEYRKKLVHFREAEEKLQQLNIDLSGKSSDFTVPDGSFGYLDVYKIFNGIKIENFYTYLDDCEENVRENDRLFQQRRKKFKEQSSNIISLKTKKQKLFTEAAELEKKMKMPFGKEGKQKRLKEIQEEIHCIDESIGEITAEFEKVLQYEKLTFDQKLAIMEYIQMRKELDEICSRYNHLYYNHPFVYSRVHLTITSEVDADLWFKALSRMFEKEDIDLAYIDKVFDQIEQAPEKWINQDLEMRSSVSSLVRNYEQMLSFFLDYVYFPEYYDVLTRRIRYTDIQEEVEEAEKIKVKK